MHIRELKIKNIRSITDFTMKFDSPAGWHVLIGDNGAGKSTIIRAIALALVGPKEALGLRADWRDWLRTGEKSGQIELSIKPSVIDKHTGRQGKVKHVNVPNRLTFTTDKSANVILQEKKEGNLPDASKYNWGTGYGWFSAAYGPFRRFAGGDPEGPKIYYAQPKLGAHLSAFGEGIALTEAIEWLIKLHHQYLENQAGETNESVIIIDNLKKLINSPDFLPHGAKITDISSKGVYFQDGNGSQIVVNQMSDGYRSILSLTFELIRQLVRVYGARSVFRNIEDGEMVIDLPGVVLVDEIDAHLHPTWQTRIGQWFLKYFPQMQFIVTSHSPLVCRASENGSIWRLAAPGSDLPSGEVTGTHKDKLVYGNVLDAYGTEVFGKDVTISESSVEKQKELVDLSKRSAAGKLSTEEKQTLKQLRKTFSTDDTLAL